MSLKAMVWAFEQDMSGLTKLVLLALSDNANSEGFCWPSVPNIAHKCGMSKPTVIIHIKTLKDLGLVYIEKRHNTKGKQISNMYYLNLNNDPDFVPDSLDIGVKTIDPPGVKTIDPPSVKTIDPLIEPINNRPPLNQLPQAVVPLPNLDEAMMDDTPDEPLEITSLQISGESSSSNAINKPDITAAGILSIIAKNTPTDFKKAKGKAIQKLIIQIHDEAEAARVRSGAHKSMLVQMKTKVWGQQMAGQLKSQVFKDATNQVELDEIVEAWLAIIKAYYVDNFYGKVAITTNTLFKFAVGEATGRGGVAAVQSMDKRVLADRFRPVVLIHASYISTKLKIRFRQEEIFVPGRIDAVWEDKISDDDDKELRDCQAVIKTVNLCNLEAEPVND